MAEYWDRCDPLWGDGGGAESFAGFIGRVDTTLDRLKRLAGKTIAVFTRGYFIHAVEARLIRPGGVVDAPFMDHFRETWPVSAPRHCEQRRIRWMG